MSGQTLPLRLGVNVDHVATLRQVRGTNYPSPLTAALIAQAAGADSITVHLREDRRHIQDHDVRDLLATLSVPLNLEIGAAPEMLALAAKFRPQACCLVPERRHELTTEGGLDVRGQQARLTEACTVMREAGARVALFVEPDVAQLDAIMATGAAAVEIHTGAWADAPNQAAREPLLARIAEFAQAARQQGLVVHAGHGLTVENTAPIAQVPEIEELNIGHSLVADAVLVGMATAVARMKNLMVQVRLSSGARPVAAGAKSYSAL